MKSRLPLENSIARLVDRLGGRSKTVERINAIRSRSEQSDGLRTLTPNMVSFWWRVEFPLGWRQLLLAAAIDAGMRPETAIEICPELAIVQHYARMTSTENAA
jgi:hypothetical protein